MVRKTGPKHKLSRREGVNLTGTSSKSLQRRLNVLPGGTRPQRRATDYAIGLRAKQRVKREYGVTEAQLRRLFDEASRMPGPTGENLLILLERRLDNAVYRAGFAPTRPMARQLVTHRHLRVNGKMADVPSSLLKPGDVLELSPEMAKVVEENRGEVFPPWLTVEGNRAQVTGIPRREDISTDIRESLIVEFYAR